MKRILLLSGVVVAVSLSACVDFSKYTKEASSVVSTLSPQAGELVASSQALLDRAQKLPADASGDLPGKVTDNHAKLTALKAEIDGLPGQIDDAVKAKDEKKVSSLLASQKEALTTKVSDGETSLKGLSAEVAAAEAKAAAAKTAKASVETSSEYAKALSSGFMVKGSPTGIEAQLVAFIQDGSRPVDKTTWFNFDRLQFKTSSAELDAEKSKEQLINIAEILKAYPKVKLKVGGYTDNKGPAAANKKLSHDRAKAVVKAIVSMGAPAARMDPEGYGAEHPVCAANDTEECRAQNRRIAVRVSAK